MSILTSDRRAQLRVLTGIDPLIIDRVTDAYDALLIDNIETYRQLMFNALAQQGLPTPIPAHERPTAVDIVRQLLVREIAKERRWSIDRTAKWLEAAVRATEERA